MKSTNGTVQTFVPFLKGTPTTLHHQGMLKFVE